MNEIKIITAFAPSVKLWAVFDGDDELITVPVVAMCLVEHGDTFREVVPYIIFTGDTEICDPRDSTNFKYYSLTSSED